MHWSRHLAEEVVEKMKPPYVVTGGMTTSGPAHLGTICEFLFPGVIAKQIKDMGKNVEFYFIADIFDAFDSITKEMQVYKEELEPHLGKPLCDVPDPTGKSRSFGDHYLDEAKEIMKKMEIEPEIVRIVEYYKEGKFDEYARLFLKEEEHVKKILEEVSGRQLKKTWSPIMPVCSSCGKIATTRVVEHDGENYKYICDLDVGYTKGCGYEGEDSIANHNYKIVWRLHWPAWKQIFKTSIEGAGVDHHTRGGSEDSCKRITKEILKKEHPLSFKYGFILLQGKKFSKSKGNGLSVRELIKLLPPEIIKYMLLRPDLQENISLDTTPQYLLKSIEQFELTARLDKKELSRSEEKRLEALKLSTDSIKWKVNFVDVIVYYQLYRNWKIVKEKLDPESVDYLAPYVEEWVNREFIPDEYAFKYVPTKAEGRIKEFLESLDVNMSAIEVHNAIFQFAKSNGIKPKEFFAELYKTLLGKEKGPRLGKLMVAIGLDRIKKDCL